jgi:hypothetical protein
MNSPTEIRATRNMRKRKQEEVTMKLLGSRDQDNEHFIVPPTAATLQSYYEDSLLSVD